MKTKLFAAGFYSIVLIFSVCSMSNAEGNEPIRFGLTLSGGGIRAAAFSYGVMRGLEEIEICVNKNYQKKGRGITEISEVKDLSLNETRKSNKDCKETKHKNINLLAAMNYLSAVSGGTITASYYMTHNDSDFKEKFGERLKNISV